jgi:hypothetical protein
MTAVGLDIASYLEAEEVSDWQLPIEHFSASSLAMLARCPRQWQERYIHGRKERPGEALVLGTAVHRVVEFNYAQKIASHADLPLTEIVTYFDDVAWYEALADRQEDGDEVKWDTDQDNARTRGRAITYGYHSQVSERVQPVSVETKIAADVGLPVPVLGYADCLTKTNVIDVKTSKQARREVKPEWRFQSAVYGSIIGLPVDFHVCAASPTTHKASIYTPLEHPGLSVWMPEEARHEAARNIRAMAWMVNHFYRQLGPDEPWPTTGMAHPWACSFCGFRSDCPAWKGLE